MAHSWRSPHDSVRGCVVGAAGCRPLRLVPSPEGSLEESDGPSPLSPQYKVT